MSKPPIRIANLPNLGPRSQAMLAEVGIESLEQLQSLGAVRAYALVKRNTTAASLNLLWGIEGALTNQDWKAVARTERLRLLTELELELAR